MRDFARLVGDGNLREYMRLEDVTSYIHDQYDFDILFSLLFHHEKRVVVRTVDTIERLTRSSPLYLESHHEALIALLLDHPSHELQLHLAQFATRLTLNEPEFRRVWAKLKYIVLNPNESKVIRVSSLQGLYDLTKRYPQAPVKDDFKNIVRLLEREHISSITARIRKLRKEALMER